MLRWGLLVDWHDWDQGNLAMCGSVNKIMASMLKASYTARCLSTLTCSRLNLSSLQNRFSILWRLFKRLRNTLQEALCVYILCEWVTLRHILCLYFNNNVQRSRTLSGTTAEVQVYCADRMHRQRHARGTEATRRPRGQRTEEESTVPTFARCAR